MHMHAQNSQYTIATASRVCKSNLVSVSFETHFCVPNPNSPPPSPHAHTNEELIKKHKKVSAAAALPRPEACYTKLYYFYERVRSTLSAGDVYTNSRICVYAIHDCIGATLAYMVRGC